jgi:hypothetical protein
MKKNILLSIFAFFFLCSSVVTASAAASTVDFEVSQLTIAELFGDRPVRFQVRRIGDLSEAATVSVTAVDGTALRIYDYQMFSNVLNFAPGQSLVEGEFAAADDSVYEAAESFSLLLSRPSPNMRLGSQRTMTVFIDDHDDYPKLMFYRGMKVEPGSGRQVLASVCIGPDRPSVEPISVSFSSSDGTATGGTDYIPISGTLTFEPVPLYEWKKCVSMTILGDGLNEPRETLSVNMFNPVNAEIRDSTMQFTIVNSVPYLQHIDFDGDGHADYAGYDSTSANWFTEQYPYGIHFGTPTDVLVPGDYTGDGQTDSAVWRPETGEWYVLRSEDGSYYAAQFGTTGDIPVPADFDADGVADFAVFRPSTGTWYIQRSSDGSTDVVQFGSEGDRPAPADFDGDWKADLAVYRPNNAGSAEWWIRRSSDSAVSVTGFGEASDRTTAGDYTGDGKADISVFRPITGQWFVLRSEDQSYYIRQTIPFPGQMPAPGDYTGDGRSDYANYSPVYHYFDVRPSYDPTPGLSSSWNAYINPSATVPLAVVNAH